MDDKTTIQPNDKRFAGEYGSLGPLLHAVRWTQHLLSIIAEVLILLSFAMSGMDVSLGGVMADIPWLKVLWAGIFALGIDTAFALSWVRVRRHLRHREWLAFAGNGLLALGMSLIVFQPVSVQLMQQSMNLTFDQAVASLGINMVFLTYARSGVAVFLGAILALTNAADEAVPVTAKRVPVRRQRFAWLKPFGRWLRFMVKRLLQWLWASDQEQPKAGASVTMNQELSAQAAVPPAPEALPEPLGTLVVEPTQEPAEQIVMTEVMAVEQVEMLADVADAPTEPLVAIEQPAVEQMEVFEQPTVKPAQPADVSAQPEQISYDTPEQRAQKVCELDLTDLSPVERVTKVIELFPALSDRELGKLSGMAPATAKKHRNALKHGQVGG